MSTLASEICSDRGVGMASSNPAPCHLVNGQPPSCSQPLSLAHCLQRFTREARWQECDTGRYRCRYASWGQGPPLVIIPGLCDDPDSFVMPMARLSEQFQCITYPMPTGVGDGARLDRYKHQDLVHDLFAVLDHAKIDQANLMGVSFGSTVALAAMHVQPERFPRGMLQCGFARRPLAWTEVALAALARWWPGKFDHLPLHRRLVEEAMAPHFQERGQEVFRYFVDHDGRQWISTIARRAWLLHHVDLRSILPAIRQPLMMICGDRDPLVSKACEQDLLQGLPNVIRAEIEQCGHLPQYTHPEVLCEVVRRFLAPRAC